MTYTKSLRLKLTWRLYIVESTPAPPFPPAGAVVGTGGGTEETEAVGNRSATESAIVTSRVTIAGTGRMLSSTEATIEIRTEAGESMSSMSGIVIERRTRNEGLSNGTFCLGCCQGLN